LRRRDLLSSIGEGLARGLEGAFAVEEARIKVRLNGPYRVEGPVVLEDADGNRFELPGGVFALCRCGGSARSGGRKSRSPRSREQVSFAMMRNPSVLVYDTSIHGES